MEREWGQGRFWGFRIGPLACWLAQEGGQRREGPKRCQGQACLLSLIFSFLVEERGQEEGDWSLRVPSGYLFLEASGICASTLEGDLCQPSGRGSAPPMCLRPVRVPHPPMEASCTAATLAHPLPADTSPPPIPHPAQLPLFHSPGVGRSCGPLGLYLGSGGWLAPVLPQAACPCSWAACLLLLPPPPLPPHHIPAPLSQEHEWAACVAGRVTLGHRPVQDEGG